MSDEVVAKGISRLAYQFSDSEKFKSFLTSFLDEFQYLAAQNDLLSTLRYLNTSQGVQLDGVGEIVGLPRPEESIEIAGVFGFVGDDTSKSFGTLDDSDIGGNFVGIDVSAQLIGDDLYRLLLRAKIIENRTTMVVDETTELLSFMLGGVKIRYIITESLKPRYDIGKFIDLFEQELLNDLPILIGLGDIEYHLYSETTPFSFADDPDGFGFGTLSDPDVGGNFATII